jgi:hypothetical protein
MLISVVTTFYGSSAPLKNFYRRTLAGLWPARVEDAADGTPAPPRGSRTPLILSALLVGSLVLGVLAALTPRFETNDDAGMNVIAAGRYLVDQPDEHLLFSNVLIGCGLKQLYQAAPNIPWYGGYLFVTASLSLMAICFACLRQDRTEWHVGLVAAYLWFAGIPALTQLQFTRVAFLATLAGLLLLAGAIRGTGAALQKWCAIPFLVAGSLIRFDAFLLACVVLSPVISWMLWRACLQKAARAPLLLLIACVAVGFSAARFNTWYYEHDPAWRNYLPFNAVRAEFIDWNHVAYDPQTAPVFTASGWLPIDLLMLKSWAFLDRERYDTKTLQAILDGLPPGERQPSRPWRSLFGRLVADGELWGLWSCGAFCLIILAADKTARFMPLACYVAAGVTCALLYRHLHLPPRVYCPVFNACIVSAILFSAGPRSFRNRRPWTESAFARGAALTVIGAVIAWRGAATFRSNAHFLSFHRQAVQMMKSLIPKPNQLFVVWAGAFPLEYVTLPLDSDSMPRDFKVLSLNWTTAFTKTRLEEFGVSDLMSIVGRGGQTYFICQNSDTKLLSAYFRAHYAVDLGYRVFFAHPALYDSTVYQVALPGAARRSP